MTSDFYIWLLLTISLYLVPFLRYSTSYFLGIDLDLWPLEVTWGQKYSHHSKVYTWLPIYLSLTLFLYLVPFSRYSTSKFLGVDLDLWPLEVTWGRKYLHFSKSPYTTSYLPSIDTFSLSRTVFLFLFSFSFSFLFLFLFLFFRVWKIHDLIISILATTFWRLFAT